MEWGIGKRKEEREREKWIKGVGDGAQVRIGNSMGWEKWLKEKTPEYLMNRTNKMSVN